VLATKKEAVLDTSQTANKELCSTLINRLRYKKEVVLDTSQTAKRFVLDSDTMGFMCAIKNIVKHQTMKRLGEN